jgi:NAD(P)-dependent dehydrogenase (short-subunit alcohol dehydrogenase family)
MQSESSVNKSILITGGTSGLGLELAKIFLRMGYEVITTGRRNNEISGYEGKFFLYITDFSNIAEVSEVFRKMLANHKPVIIINNAGILSPADRTITSDGLEYTFQVNFLVHLLLSEMAIKKSTPEDKLKIVSITSPVYKMAAIDISANTAYKSLKAYSSSKLYLALLGRYLCEKYPEKQLNCYSFDPGTFGSGIYRMRGSFFSFLYRIAFPFMKRSSAVAATLAETIMRGNVENGWIINRRNKVVKLPDFENEDKFWNHCAGLIGAYT